MARQPCMDERGFTLAEAAIVLCVLALVVGVLVPAFLSMRLAEQGRATDRKMESAMQAIAAYVQANGCVPCPTPAIGMTGHGVVGIQSGSACGLCQKSVGVLPFKSLGLPEQAALDGYGGWMTYAVDGNLAVNFGIVPPASPCRTGDTTPCTATDITNGTRKKGLCAAGLSTARRLSVTTADGGSSQAAVMLVSHGANQYGAYISMIQELTARKAFRRSGTCATVSEMCNADGDTSFYNGLAGNDPVNPFDDRLLYLDRNALVTYLGGQACNTVW
jgi:type II secretory pathway pseudopilin PulG